MFWRWGGPRSAKSAALRSTGSESGWNGRTACHQKGLEGSPKTAGDGETSLHQRLLETEVETAEAWATYLAECFDSYRLIQHAGVYSIAGDCSGADTPWQVSFTEL